MAVNTDDMQISIEVHDSLKVKKRIHKAVAELDNKRIFSVRINNSVHFHGPGYDKVTFHQVIGTLIDPVDISLSGANQSNLSIGMPMHLITSSLKTCAHIDGTSVIKIVGFVPAVVHRWILYRVRQ